MILLMRYKPFVSFVVQFFANVTGKKFKNLTFLEFFFLVSNICFLVNAIDDNSGILGDQPRRYLDILNLVCLFLVIVISVLTWLYMITMKII